jgi:hypothetical protein
MRAVEDPIMASPVKATWFRLLPGSLQGIAEYFFGRDAEQDFGVFNGQQGRQRLVERLIAEFEPRVIVETGTFRATTTLWFARFRVPVYTVEISDRHYAYSKLKLLSAANVRPRRGHSVPFLRRLYRDGSLSEGPMLFYLDAHFWHGELPLRDELQIIFGHPVPALVLIDDFAVPGDRGYKFDDHGPDRKLHIEYLRTVSTPDPMHVFFPSTPSQEETGFRRGCCLVTTSHTIAERLRGMQEARFWGVLEDTADLRTGDGAGSRAAATDSTL